MKGISVIVCCYNSSKRLPETLKYLALQHVPTHLLWELIVIDNASIDNTKNVANVDWCRFNRNIPFRVIGEIKPGLSNARNRGIKESKYEYLIFCDDDNWLSPDYVFEAYKSMEENSTAGAIGGIGFPACEVEPPEWFLKNKLSYAVGSQGYNTKEIEDITESKGYVYGAGAVFRKRALSDLEIGGFENIVTDRIGNLLVSGGDNELCYGLILFGYKILYNPKLVFKHFIPTTRLTKSYLRNFSEAHGFSSMLLLPYQYKLKNRSLTGIKTQWWWILSATVFLFLKNDFPHILIKKYYKDFSLQLQVAIRIGAIKSTLKNWNMFKRNFYYVKSLGQNRAE